MIQAMPRTWVISSLFLFVLGAAVSSAEPTTDTGTAATAVSTIDGELAVFKVAADIQELEALRREFDVWAYYPVEQVAVMALDHEQHQRLVARGVTVELDRERTRDHLGAREGVEQTAGGGIPGFACYRTVEETFADLLAATQLRPSLAAWTDIGDSWLKTVGQGGFDQQVLVLTNENIPGDKPVFLLMAAMHAREYATAEIATRFALHLITGYGVDPVATWLLDHREIHVVPQQNPDGRKEAETGLFWRKNSNNDFCAGSNDRGVDLNRNSTFFWGGGASSGSQCNETYRGPSAASEPETASIEDYMAQVFLDQKGDMDDPAPADAQGVFISIHSFGELVLYPWEGTNNDGPNHAQLRTLGRKFGFFNQYSVCQDCLGTASGTTVDAAYGEYGVAAYTFEVGNSFFESCTPFESTIYPDNLEALLYAAKVADRPYQKPGGPEATDLQLTSVQVAAGMPVTVSAMLDDTRFRSGGFGTETTQNIMAARAGFDLALLEGGGGSPMTATDGVFDETLEEAEVSLDTTGLEAGMHLVFVIGQDITGQWGPAGAIFVEITSDDTIFADGFESGNTSLWASTLP